MKISSLFAALFCLVLVFCGCATHQSPLSVGAKAETGDRQGMSFDINTNCSLIVGRQVSWWPSSDYHGTILDSGSHGYVLHAGTYKPECEDEQGIFFKGPGWSRPRIGGRKRKRQRWNLSSKSRYDRDPGTCLFMEAGMGRRLDVFHAAR